ncbi:hypothetical protein Tco_1137354 [Tanacetum coccineum]
MEREAAAGVGGDEDDGDDGLLAGVVKAAVMEATVEVAAGGGVGFLISVKTSPLEDDDLAEEQAIEIVKELLFIIGFINEEGLRGTNLRDSLDFAKNLSVIDLRKLFTDSTQAPKDWYE